MRLLNWLRRRTPSSDMRDTAIDNPLDYRADGSIREGDPAWAAMMEVMNSGQAAMFNQRRDGTWEKQ